ncbi:probable aspartic proteinase GIP2 [Vicia villosa]|uniref:probable aspartic proteinase GIP2 n=1 Tax=Vicia villosa TaxID=3911 RepID=UPI00273B54B1|nr:probable aspartic proteinase GIP2 [Vicia villosa]
MTTSSLIIHFFILSLSLLSLSSLSASSQPHSFILPIRKDPSTNLFYTSLGIGTPRTNFNLAIDLGGENLWYDCDTHYNSSSYTPIHCDSKQCPEIGCIGCNGPFKPGCTNNTCPSPALNSFAKFIYGGGLGQDFIFISQTKVSGLLSSCIDTDSFPSFTGNESALNGLPKNTKGIIGLSRSNLSLPKQLALKNKLPPRFSLCLPSSNKQGYTNLLAGSDNKFSKFVQTTPLIVNPFSTGPVSVKGVSSNEYFIDVKAIKIDGQVLNLKPSLLTLNKKGNGGTKISTLTPFTELHTTVYKPFIRDFLKKASDRKLKRVKPVAPFEACFDSTSIGKSLPRVDLVLQKGVQWTIHETNLLVNVRKNVACVGIVDGGTESRMSFTKPSIVIGGHQLVDNLLVFDLSSSKLSFSSSLLVHNASCS